MYNIMMCGYKLLVPSNRILNSLQYWAAWKNGTIRIRADNHYHITTKTLQNLHTGNRIHMNCCILNAASNKFTSTRKDKRFAEVPLLLVQLSQTFPCWTVKRLHFTSGFGYYGVSQFALLRLSVEITYKPGRYMIFNISIKLLSQLQWIERWYQQRWGRCRQSNTLFPSPLIFDEVAAWTFVKICSSPRIILQEYAHPM